MAEQPRTEKLVAVDVGNSRIKLGMFHSVPVETLPLPSQSLSLPCDWQEDQIISWLLDSHEAFEWVVASVNRSAADRLMGWAAQRGSVRQLGVADLGLNVDLERRDLVGIDRLADALAANRLREPDRPAIIIDLGSAITVDLISAEGAFSGGAILPGIATAARALHEFTDLLPLVAMTELDEPPPALGKSTRAAMRSGLYWGAIGALRELIKQLTQGLSDWQIFLTGGAAPTVANLLHDDRGRPARYIPHLTLSGIAIAAARTAHE